MVTVSAHPLATTTKPPSFVPILLAGLLLLLTTACRQDHANRVTVFAAASLTNVFEELSKAFERAHPDTHVELHCAGTTRLVLQLREGAPADVFASADTLQMQRVVDAGHAVAPAQAFASNQLAIITAKENPHGIATLQDLRLPVTMLMCGPQVPAGRYARAALAKANVQLESKSDEPSVRAVLSKVKLGLVDAGIVYATDARTITGHDGDELQAIVIAKAHNITASYPIVALSTGSQRSLGEAFVAFVLSPDGQRILTSHGFGTP